MTSSRHCRDLVTFLCSITTCGFFLSHFHIYLGLITHRLCASFALICDHRLARNHQLWLSLTHLGSESVFTQEIKTLCMQTQWPDLLWHPKLPESGVLWGNINELRVVEDHLSLQHDPQTNWYCDTVYQMKVVLFLYPCEALPIKFENVNILKSI